MKDKPERDDYSLKPDGLIDYQDAVINWQEKRIAELEEINLCFLNGSKAKDREIFKLDQRISELMKNTVKVKDQRETIAKLREALEKIANDKVSYMIQSCVAQTALKECFGEDNG